MDGRKRPRMSPPDNTPRTIQVVLSADDYRRLCEITYTKGTSLADAVRALVRDAYDNLKG